jgi:ribosome-associated translation inhibitor RaiA
MMNDRQQTLTRQPRLGTGFAESERTWVTRRLAPLTTRLRSFPDTAVELDLSVKDRDGADPRVTLVCRIAGQSRLVATAAAQTLSTAVIEVRDDMIRQVAETRAAKLWHRPRSARH